jgi:hypothetical protein
MTHRLHWFFIGGVLAGCTSPSSPVGTVPDHFDENLDVIMRSVAHPCGADEDTDGDGVIDVHRRYSYDAEGRSLKDVGTDLTGALYDQTDYAWDNAGHLTDEDYRAPGLRLDNISTFDTLGRRIEFRVNQGADDVVDRITTITYSGFDDLGHAAHGDQIIQDLVANTSKMQTRSYRVDELGRRIALDVRAATGELLQGFQHVYDDTARTVTTTLTVPHGVQGDPGSTGVFVDTYDADSHLIASHEVYASLDGATTGTTDTQNQWAGDRQLSSRTISTLFAGSAITFKYECGASRASGPR